jgi:hypothetical protein
MMLEEVLAYRSATHLTEPFSDLLAADLDDDARQFYLRMALDLTVLDEEPAHRNALLRALLAALRADPAGRATAWRHLYREIAAALADRFPDALPVAGDPTLIAALRRLRAFLAENVDLACAVALEDLERSLFRTAPGAVS